MKTIPVTLALATMIVSAGASAAAARTVSLSQKPFVMRLQKDEFRIAFGINGERCAPSGCNGSIRYRVDWKTMNGVKHSDVKQVNYTVSPHASRTIAVDQQYFDTAEGEQTTAIVKVSVDRITCRGAD